MSRLLQIALLGHPVLRKTAAAIDDVSDPSVQDLIDDMIATMHSAKGVGLAAPQVYASLRVFIMQSRPSERYPDAPDMPPTAVINPFVISQSEETITTWEGCLSMPGYKGLVERPAKIKAAWTDRDGNAIEMELSNLPARVFQHELDHLDGVMFLERMESSCDLISNEVAGFSTVDEKLLLLNRELVK